MKNLIIKYVIGAVRSAVINWATSSLGVFVGGPELLEGINSMDWRKILHGGAIVLLGLFAKDANVTGGTVKQ